MLMTKRKPATVGEILVEEFMTSIGLTQGALADAAVARTLCAKKESFQANST
jgi:plasmid maintenance system antidote protein VapI